MLAPEKIETRESTGSIKLDKRSWFVWLGLWGVIVVWGFIIHGIYKRPDIAPFLTLLTVGTAVLVIVVVRYVLKHSWDSVPLVYFYYLALAHLPMFVIWLLDPSAVYVDYKDSQLRWLANSNTGPVLFIILASLIGFVIGVALNGERKADLAPLADGHRPLFIGGLLVVLFAAGLYLYAVFAGGGFGVLFFSPYSVIRERIYTENYHWGIFLIAIGSGLALIGVSKPRWPLALLPFALLAVPLLIGGDRGAVLYPSLAYVAVLGQRGIKLPRTRVLFLLLFVLFFIIPMVKEMRQVGLASFSWQQTGGWVNKPFMEMGFTARTVEITYDIIENGPLDFVYGGSYWLPVERQLALLLPFLDRGDVYADPRNTKIFTVSKGYSVMAEAYYNFGFAGSLLVFILLGYLLSWLQRRARTSPYYLAWVVVLLTILIENVRNSFISVPGRLLTVLLIIGFIWFGDHLRRRREVEI
jgi:oligosaccharide repeat unit polymerase